MLAQGQVMPVLYISDSIKHGTSLTRFETSLSLEAVPVVVVQLQEGMVDLLGRDSLLHL